MHRILYYLFILATFSLLSACSHDKAEEENAGTADSISADAARLVGMWRMVDKVAIPEPGVEPINYAPGARFIPHTYKAYEPNGMCYKFTPGHYGDEQKTFIPETKETFHLEITDTDTLYYEGNLQIKVAAFEGDSILVIKWGGDYETWKRLTDFPVNRRHELEAVADELIGDGRFMRTSRIFDRFVHNRNRLSAQNRLIIWLVLIMLFFAAQVFYFFYRKRQLERTLAELQEEIEERPAVIAEATQTARDELYESPWYVDLSRRLADGEHLTDDDWTEVAHQVRRIFPHFRSSLYNLCRLSDTEFRVCLLLKLHIAPAEIATALCKEKSTVSSSRSRLYAKVFGKKGSSKDWDEFIESM